MKIKVSRIFGVALALALPAVAVAALEIPHVFVSGDVISSSEMNANFDAIKAKMDALEAAQVASEETIVALTARLDAHESHEDWQTETLQNSWVDYSDEYSASGYWKDTHGVVHLKGLVKGGTQGADYAIFQLPEGYRPSAREIHLGGVNNGKAPIYIGADGRIIPDPYGQSEGAVSDWISLSGISFLAEN